MFYLREESGELHGIKQGNIVGFCEDCGALVHVDLPAYLEAVRLEGTGMEISNIEHCAIACDECDVRYNEEG